MDVDRLNVAGWNLFFLKGGIGSGLYDAAFSFGWIVEKFGGTVESFPLIILTIYLWKNRGLWKTLWS